MTLNLLQILLSALAGGLVMFLFNRIARSLDLGFAKDERTEGKIEKVDTQARASIARLESELRHTADDIKSSLIMDLKERMTRVEETIRHMPSGEQIDKLIDRLGLVEREVGVIGAKTEGVSDMVRTIRDHIMEGERR